MCHSCVMWGQQGVPGVEKMVVRIFKQMRVSSPFKYSTEWFQHPTWLGYMPDFKGKKFRRHVTLWYFHVCQSELVVYESDVRAYIWSNEPFLGPAGCFGSTRHPRREQKERGLNGGRLAWDPYVCQVTPELLLEINVTWLFQYLEDHRS